jgi:AmmeMemoRadiSam system protein A
MGGDYELAVGYAAIAFTVEEDTSASSTTKAAKAKGASSGDPAKTANPGPAMELQQLDLVTPEEQETLLRLARTAIERAFRESTKEEPFDPKEFELTETLHKPFGAFVTLTLDDNLRGCIGYITGRKALYQTILENARNAAFRDPRFTPLAADELPGIHIEISVLSPLEEVQPKDVVVGRDGLVLSKEGYSGVLLPQVPVEYGWTREEFLDHLCRKAGLPRGSWRNGATLQRFGAQVFGEHDH